MLVQYDLDLVNKDTYEEIARKRLPHAGRYNNFARKILKNDFFKKKLLEMYQNTCPFCGLPLTDPKNVQLHHVTYDHLCIYQDYDDIMAEHVHQNGKISMSKVPPCERCYKEHPGSFARCESLIVPVHGRCHMRIHDLWNTYVKMHIERGDKHPQKPL